MPSAEEVERFLRCNEAVRVADLKADRERTMSQRLADVAHLSEVGTSMREAMPRREDAPGLTGSPRPSTIERSSSS